MPRSAVSGLFAHVPRAGAARALIVAACALSFAAAAPAQVPPTAAVPASGAATSPASAARPATSAASVPGRAPARTASGPRANGRQLSSPTWRELGAAEQQALAPLAASWDTLSLAQRRKWRALSHNFSKLSPEEQAKLHSRMTEWVALSPQQRTEARLNFGATKQVPPDEKKAKWEAYQALSPEEKSKLAAAAAKTPPTAAAVRPVPADKLAAVPRPKNNTSAPRHGIVPAGKLDRNTLLPRRPGASAATPAPARVPASSPAAPAAPAASAASVPAKAG